ncbi:cytosine deaminase [Paenibacillus rhizosphaerae]|uniref:Cytosine deaminase n=1 Tax=Paenibacillus rhizosphaerae TaxID=297318 RepID=A0A839TMG5_9BACL|nr:amidohydrolase family protein [Paenibacillus rhizosphaerae]MBB3127975.1 cytosine deaminase [Paenibacillus rhizosphaerae]
MEQEVVIFNASLPLQSEETLYTLVISGGKWTSVTAQTGKVEDYEAVCLDKWNGSTADRRLQLDAKGKIVLPGFVDAHMHLDKAFSLPQVGNVSGTLGEAVVNYAAAAAKFSKEEIKARIIRSALQSISYGTVVLRSHLDFHVKQGKDVAMRTIEAALEVKEELQPYAELQLFPLLPYFELSEAALDTAKESVVMGVTGLGGAPHLSPNPEPDIDRLFALADKLGCPVDLHTDESDDPNQRTAVHIARRTLEYGWSGKVTAGHLCSLAAMKDEDAAMIIGLMAEAGMGAVTLPGANLYLQGRHDAFPVRRGVTRVKELLSAGIPLAAASDNIHDPFHPFGKGDLLLIGLVTAYAAHMGSPSEMREVLRMITEYPARVTGADGYGILPGNPAHFVVLDARTPEELLTMLPERRWVWRGGTCLKAASAKEKWSSAWLQDYWEDACERIDFVPKRAITL